MVFKTSRDPHFEEHCEVIVIWKSIGIGKYWPQLSGNGIGRNWADTSRYVYLDTTYMQSTFFKYFNVYILYLKIRI